jgi:hypothetical protein
VIAAPPPPPLLLYGVPPPSSCPIVAGLLGPPTLLLLQQKSSSPATPYGSSESRSGAVRATSTRAFLFTDRPTATVRQPVRLCSTSRAYKRSRATASSPIDPAPRPGVTHQPQRNSRLKRIFLFSFFLDNSDTFRNLHLPTSGRQHTSSCPDPRFRADR